MLIEKFINVNHSYGVTGRKKQLPFRYDTNASLLFPLTPLLFSLHFFAFDDPQTLWERNQVEGLLGSHKGPRYRLGLSLHRHTKESCRSQLTADSLILEIIFSLL